MQHDLEVIAGHSASILAIMQKDTSKDSFMVKHHTKKILSTISELKVKVNTMDRKLTASSKKAQVLSKTLQDKEKELKCKVSVF